MSADVGANFWKGVPMDTVTTRLFDTYEHAKEAVADLEASGVPHDAISLVANNADNRHAGDQMAVEEAEPVDAVADSAGTGASVGTVLGGGAGLLAGLGMLAIPGIGPVVAAGWLVATALGAGVGAASGGLLGSLIGAGVAETDAHAYAEGVRRGGPLVTVRTAVDQSAMVEALLAKHAAVDIGTRADEYRRGGWSRFDESAPAYTAGGSPGIGSMPPTA